MSDARFAVRSCRLAVVILASIVGHAVPGWADALSDGRFRDEVVSIIHEIRPAAVIRPDADPTQIRIGERTIALDNLYGHLRNIAASGRRREIESFLASFLPGPGGAVCCASATYEKVKPRLRVQLLPRDFLREHPELVQRPFSTTLAVVYVLDEPKRYRYVTRDMVAEWGVDLAAVEAVAVTNLAEASQDVAAELAVDGDQPSYLLSRSGDDYDAARLLLPRFLEELRKALKAESIVVAAPTRGLLMAWPSGSKKHAALAVAATKLMNEGPYSRSDELFQFDGRNLRPLSATEQAGQRR